MTQNHHPDLVSQPPCQPLSPVYRRVYSHDRHHGLKTLMKPSALTAMALAFLIGVAVPSSLYGNDDVFQNAYDIEVEASKVQTLPYGAENAALAPYENHAKQQKEKKKHSWWPFGKKDKPPTDEEIINVGPREQPAYADPLFRLPLPIHSTQRLIEPGFYLARLEKTQNTPENLILWRGSIPIVTLPLEPASLPASAGSPIESTVHSSNRPAHTQVEVQVSPNQQQLTITVWEGDTPYRTRPIPTALDQRKTWDY